MGFLFLFNGIILIFIIVVVIIHRDEQGISTLLVIPLITFLITGGVIAAISSKSFDKEKLTTIDRVVDVVVMEDDNGNEQHVFPYFDGKFIKISGFRFDETVVGSEMKVHLIQRETPKNFFTFGSTSKKAILIIPENKER
jgi:hypothetical protein